MCTCKLKLRRQPLNSQKGGGAYIVLAPGADGLEERCVLLGVQRAVVVLVAVQEDRLDHILRLDEQPAQTPTSNNHGQR